MPIKNKTASTLKKRKRGPSLKSTDSHYVDNKKFYQTFVEYHEKRDKALKEGKPEPKLPDYIGECFLKIADRFSHHANFINYPYREEMISDAVENCVLYAHDFNPKRGKNPFAYFSQVTWNAYIRRINKENKNKYLTYKAHQNQLVASGTMYAAGEDGVVSRDLYENINTFIEDYERKAKEKRAEKKKRLAAAKSEKTKK